MKHYVITEYRSGRVLSSHGSFREALLARHALAEKAPAVCFEIVMPAREVEPLPVECLTRAALWR